jgi:hypothetical protein
MKIKIELSGGLDICFEKKKEFFFELEESTITVGNLIKYLRENFVKEKPEFFTTGTKLYFWI